MLFQTIRICPSELFTDFTNVLRYTVIRFSLIFQRVEVCRYGFYGLKVYTPYIYTDKKIKTFKRVRARKGIYDTVKSVKSVKRILETFINQHSQGFTDFQTHRKKITDFV